MKLGCLLKLSMLFHPYQITAYLVATALKHTHNNPQNYNSKNPLDWNLLLGPGVALDGLKTNKLDLSGQANLTNNKLTLLQKNYKANRPIELRKCNGFKFFDKVQFSFEISSCRDASKSTIVFLISYRLKRGTLSLMKNLVQ